MPSYASIDPSAPIRSTPAPAKVYTLRYVTLPGAAQAGSAANTSPPLPGCPSDPARYVNPFSTQSRGSPVP